MNVLAGFAVILAFFAVAFGSMALVGVGSGALVGLVRGARRSGGAPARPWWPWGALAGVGGGTAVALAAFGSLAVLPVDAWPAGAIPLACWAGAAAAGGVARVAADGAGRHL